MCRLHSPMGGCIYVWALLFPVKAYASWTGFSPITMQMLTDAASTLDLHPFVP